MFCIAERRVVIDFCLGVEMEKQKLFGNDEKDLKLIFGFYEVSIYSGEKVGFLLYKSFGFFPLMTEDRF